MFNNKIKNELTVLKDEFKNLNHKIEELKSDLEYKNNDLNKIIETLESKEFTVDWQEYQKYKEMKDNLPDIEELYQLKKLKKVILKLDDLDKEKELYKQNLLKSCLSANSYNGYNKIRITAFTTFLENTRTKIKTSENDIKEILNYIKEKSKNKDLLDIFKLYGISTHWLQP